ncbi:hypothetical protein KFE25_000038 [Diacronema lutheri]|uniref:Hexosyltransferase n=1 Tax=Diacronema lutheri TaxID=2081491 RepID=A0A8J5XR14_DIALT|nr:hypothetical protein KFE25_000038 [Diacronema lutheri]
MLLAMLAAAGVVGTDACALRAALADVIVACSGGAIRVPEMSAAGHCVESADDLKALARFALEVFDCSTTEAGAVGTLRDTLVVHVTGSLAQRLMVYATARAVARDRRLLVVWERDSACAATFDELFEHPTDALVVSSAYAFSPAVFHRTSWPQAFAARGASAAGVSAPDGGQGAHAHMYIEPAPDQVINFAERGGGDAALAYELRALQPHAAVLELVAKMLFDAGLDSRSARNASDPRVMQHIDGGSMHNASGLGAALHAVGLRIHGARDVVLPGDLMGCDERSVPILAAALRAACAALERGRRDAQSARAREAVAQHGCIVLVHVDDDEAASLALRAMLAARSPGLALALLRSADEQPISHARIDPSSSGSASAVEPAAQHELGRRREQAALAKLLGLSRAAQLILPSRASSQSRVALLLSAHAHRTGSAASVDACSWAAGAAHAERALRLSSAPEEPSPAIVSVVAACCGRHAQLEGNLPSWLAVTGSDELVIVDWSSDPALQPALETALAAPAAGPQSSRVLLARVAGEVGWVLSRAFNIGFRLCSGALILKLDCDVRAQPSLVLEHLHLLAVLTAPATCAMIAHAAASPAARRNAFVAGDWRLASSANELHLNGLFIAWADALRAVGGFDERITTYGWDDSDLFARLKAIAGARRRALNASLAEHVAHTSEARLEHSGVRARASVYDAAEAEHVDRHGDGGGGVRDGDGDGRSSRGSHRVGSRSVHGLTGNDGALAELVGATSESEVDLSAEEASSVAIQQNRIALERLPSMWGRTCDRGSADGMDVTSMHERGGDTTPFRAGGCDEDLAARRRRFEAWCGSDYDWIEAECNLELPRSRLVVIHLRASRVTPSLRAVVGSAGWLAAWYEALAQELPNMRNARRRTAPSLTWRTRGDR